MFRTFTLIFTAAALCACATSPLTNGGSAQTPPDMSSADMATAPVLDTAQSADEASDSADTSQDTMAAEPAADAKPAAPKLENLYYVAQTKWEMMSFVEAVNAAELATALEADGALTVFAPTSDAFAQAGDVAATADVLKGHIVSGKLMAADLVSRAAKGESTLSTLAGTELTLYVMGDTVKVADASGRLYTVVTADNEASNGVLHQINGVLAQE